MSITLIKAVFLSDLGPYERLVMLALADRADDQSCACYPSISDIVSRTGMKERGVQNVIKRLVEIGVLFVAWGGGRHQRNTYTINLNTAPDAGYRLNSDNQNPASGAPFQQKPRTENTVSDTETPHSKTDTPHSTTLNPAPDAGEPSLTTIEPEEKILDAQDAPPKKTRRCQLPNGWVPSQKNIDDAYSKNFTDEEIENEACKFRDHHAAKATVFADWDAAWRTWIGNARKFSTRGNMAGRAAPGRYGQGGSIASIVARRRFEGAV